jgi:hypothetical protein
MIFDVRTEKRKAEEWEQGNSEETIPLSEIADIAAVGLTYCKDYCSSRETVGQASCYCVRARFPTPEHYQLYLKARHEYQRILAARIAAGTIGENYGKQDDKS